MLTELLLQFTLVGAEWVLWLLVLLSFVSIVVVVERLIFFFGHSHRPTARLLEALREGRFDEARTTLESVRGMVAEAIGAGLRHAEKGPEAVEAVVASEVAASRQRYDRFLVYLGTVGSNAPFVGLFGTVLGIIRAFADLAASEKGGADVVMAGISEALVATAVGIGVAIPAVVFYNLFARWLKRITQDTTAATQALLAGLRAARGGEEG